MSNQKLEQQLDSPLSNTNQRMSNQLAECRTNQLKMKNIDNYEVVQLVLVIILARTDRTTNFSVKFPEVEQLLSKLSGHL